MFIAKDKNGKMITAEKAEENKEYYCPICGSPLILKDGPIYATHFAHKADTCNDSWHYDKSPWHRRMQNYFPVENQEVIVEHNGEKHIADVLQDGIVIEFQHSSISMNEFQERNEFYREAGYKVVWVIDLSDAFETYGRIDYEESANGNYYYRWRNPRQYLLPWRKPSDYDRDAAIYFYWHDPEFEMDVLNKVCWSTTDGEGNPDFKRFMVSDVIELQSYNNLEDDGEADPDALRYNMTAKMFLMNSYDRLNSLLKSNERYTVLKMGRAKGFPKGCYICPKTKEFGLKERNCYRCKSMIAEEGLKNGGKNLYCSYPEDAVNIDLEGRFYEGAPTF